MLAGINTTLMRCVSRSITYSSISSSVFSYNIKAQKMQQIMRQATDELEGRVRCYLEIADLALLKLIHSAHELAALQCVVQTQALARKSLVQAQQQRSIHQVLLEQT